MGRWLIALGLAALVAVPVRGTEGADYAWPDLAGCVRQLHDKVGAARVYRLEMDRDGVAELWIQDPARPDLVDRYPCANGTLGGATPVKFREYPTVAALDHHVIDPAAIEFARLPGMLASARAKLGLVDARVVTIRLERGDSSGALTWSDIPIWTFDVETPRHDGRVEFNLQGSVLDVDKD